MKSYLLFLGLFVALTVCVAATKQYKIVAQHLSDEPIISQEQGSAFITTDSAGLFTYGDEIGIMLDAFDNQGQAYYVAYSKLNYSKDGSISALQPLCNMTLNLPDNSSNPEYGRDYIKISYFDGFYYLHFAEFITGLSHISLAKSATPFDVNSWEVIGRVLSPNPLLWLSVLWATKENQLKHHYLFYDGANGIDYATSNETNSWTLGTKPVMRIRDNYFDSYSIKVGSTPVQLKSKDFLFLYSARSKDSINNASVGWAILDSEDPANVLQRSNFSIMNASFDWEYGQISLDSIIPDPFGCPSNIAEIIGSEYVPNAECFVGIFGGSVNIGAVRVVSSWIDEDNCKDVDKDCQTLTSECSNSLYNGIMCKYCRKTCNLCNDPKCNSS